MYLEHFQLARQPFSEHAAVTSLWQDGRMAEGLARLEYLVGHGVLGLVTGPTGVGKSALLKQFLHGIGAQHCEAVYCHLSHLPSAGMLKLLVTQLGDVPRQRGQRKASWSPRRLCGQCKLSKRLVKGIWFRRRRSRSWEK